jgi:glutamine synthetase
MKPDDGTKRMPIDALRQEEGAEELMASPDMEPYVNFAVALMRGADPISAKIRNPDPTSQRAYKRRRTDRGLRD